MKELSDINASRISLAIHTIMGMIAGYFSVFTGRTLYSIGLGVAVLIITGYATEFIVKKKGIKWWMTNGGILYILVWVVIWIYVFNMV